MTGFDSIKFLVSGVLAIGLLVASSKSLAGIPSELDNEASITNEQVRLAADLPGTVVVRTHSTTGEVEVLQVTEKLGTEATSQESVLRRAGEFTSAASLSGTSTPARGELDADSSKNSWYFYFPYSSYYSYWPSYYYTGYSYNYSPYYHFNWGGYGYSYYRWCRCW